VPEETRWPPLPATAAAELFVAAACAVSGLIIAAAYPTHKKTENVGLPRGRVRIVDNKSCACKDGGVALRLLVISSLAVLDATRGRLAVILWQCTGRACFCLRRGE